MCIELVDLKKRYVAPDGSSLSVVDIPHLRLGSSEQAALIGSSGSGKTTLLHLIAGLLTADSGKILLHTATGVIDLARLGEPDRDRTRGRYIGYVFQTHHLLPGFTALENVLLGMSFTGRAADRKWAEHLLREVGLQDRLHYKPAKLSVGQQQRVAVARALANRPKLVLADEPTGSLDADNARQVLGLIRSLCAEAEAALLLVTHDRQVAEQFPMILDLAQVNRPVPVGVS